MIRITIVHQAALGDTILLLPLIRALRRKFASTSSHISIVTHTNLGQMFTMFGYTDAHFSANDQIHAKWFVAPDSPTQPNSRPEWIDCDYLLSAVSNGNDPWAANARLALPENSNRILFFEPRPPADYPHHVTHYHREQLAQLNLLPPPLPLLQSNPDGAIIVHPGSGGEAKCWPRDKFLALAQNLKRNGILPTFILGEAEQERWGYHLINQLQNEFPWYLHMGLYELSVKMSRARLFIGNDAGVSHLAAALGLPVITLFGPSNEHQWHPIGPQVKILRAPSPNEKDLTALEEQTVLTEILAELRKVN